MRIAYYAGASTAAAAACLLKAFSQRPNFYSATVYLSQSNACLLVLTNLLLVLASSFMYALQRLLYGPLRPIEIEQLSEKAWYAVLDTLLAMPSFREDVGGWLLTMFVLLLAGKVWGWIGEGRVDILEQQPPSNPTLFHARLSTSLLLSVAFSLYMLKYCIESVIEDPRPGMMVIFTFEFAILSIFSTFTLARYSLALVDAGVVKKQVAEAIETRKSEIRAERATARATAAQEGRDPPVEGEPIEVDENEVDVPGWEDKRRYLFYLEVITDFIKLVIYITFFTVSVTFNGLPMHIMRDVYMTFASFSKRITDFMAYRRATTEMNTRYPDATTEEIQGDACIVCRESMVAWAAGEPQAEVPVGGQQPAAPAAPRRRDEGLRAKKLPCGHILHMRCLKSWLERQQVCPTCRRPVVAASTPNVAGAARGGQPGQRAQPGQPGQPPADRPRGRIFNLGPLRVGLINAPGGQMRNIMNQLQNGGAAPAQNANGNEAAAAAASAAPAVPGQPVIPGEAPRLSGLRSQVPTDVQLARIEAQVVQQAHNLGLDQQQLATVRMLQNELARLRSLRIASPPGTAVGQSARYPMPGFAPQHSVQLSGIPNLRPQVQGEVLRGSAMQQYGNGHQSLPQGLVLPEGWTATPLHRMGGQPQLQSQSGPQSTVPVSSAAESSTHVSPPEQPDAALAPATGHPLTAATQPAESTVPTPGQSSTAPHGPTDERGSPLFVPAEGGTGPRMPPQNSPDTSGRTALAPPTDSTEESPPQFCRASASVASPAPWEGASWGFDAPPAQTAQAGSTGEAAAELPLGQATREENEAQRDKGKGRAVEVEDAPDPEA